MNKITPEIDPDEEWLRKACAEIDRIKSKVKAAARRHGMSFDEYYFKHLDDIYRHNRFP